MDGAGGRGILSGQAAGGYLISVTRQKVLIHHCVESNEQMDTIYLYGYCEAERSNCTVEITCEDVQGVRFTVTTRQLKSQPTTPSIIINGMSKNAGSQLYARCLVGSALLYGFYSRTVIDIPISVRSSIGQMILSTQTLSWSGTETQVINPAIPVTFCVTNSVTQTPAIALLPGNVQAGTMKIVVLLRRNPSLADYGDDDKDRGNLLVKPNRALFPAGAVTESTGFLKLKTTAESFTVVYNGSAWMLTHVGCYCL